MAFSRVTLVSDLRFANMVKQNSDNNSYFLTFSSEEKAKSCLNQLKKLIANDTPSIKSASVSQYAFKSEVLYRFQIWPEQLNALRTSLRKSAAILKPKDDFYFKSLRGDTKNYFFRFMEELIDPRKKFPKRLGDKKNFTVTGEGIFRRNPNVKSTYPLKTPQYTTLEKAGFTNFQSTSLGLSDFYPPVFGFDREKKLSVGVMFDPKNVLLSNRLYVYDGGTVTRQYDHKNEWQAEKYERARLGTILFSKKQFDEFKLAVKASKNLNQHSEALARLQWDTDGTSKVFIATDNLESRLLAKQYADSILAELKNEGRCSADYQVPICFYTPENPDLLFKEYTPDEYQLDSLEANFIYLNPSQKKEKYKNDEYEFLFALSPEKIKEALSEEIEGLPLAIYLLNKGYVHIVRFLMVKSDFTLEKSLNKIQANTEKYQEIIFSILQQALSHEDHVLAEYVFNRLSLDLIKTKIAHDSSLLNTAKDKKLFDWIIRFIHNGLVESKDNNGNTLLHWAANNGSTEFISLLLKKGEKIDAKNRYGDTPLSLAAQNGHTEAVRLLLDMGAKHYRLCFLTAALNGHTEIVKLFLDKGVDIETISKNNQTALHLAAIGGHTELLQLLLERKANIHAKDKNGITILEAAIVNDQLSVVDLLLKRGVSFEDVNDDILRKHGGTLLREAARFENIEILQILLKKGVNTESYTKMGFTPLTWAATRGNIDIVRLLLENGASIEAKDKNGYDALHCAEKIIGRNSKEKILNLLQSALKAKSVEQEARQLSSKNPKNLVALRIANLFHCYAHPPLFSLSWRNHSDVADTIADKLSSNDSWDFATCKQYIDAQIKNIPYNPAGTFAGLMFEVEKIGNEILPSTKIRKQL